MREMRQSQEGVGDGKLFVGVDLGGTTTRGVVGLSDGTLLAIHKVPTPAHDGQAVILETLLTAANLACMAAGVDESAISGWGVGTPGPVDHRSGVVYGPPTLPGWDIPLRKLLKQRIRKPVRVANDANLAAVAEWLYGAGVGTRDLVYITVSTGVGGGVISGGRLLLGHHGAAAEIGHMIVDCTGPVCGCGNRGCLEALASGTAIARMAREELAAGAETVLRSAGSIVGPTEVMAAAREGDQVGCAILARAAAALCAGVVNLVNLFNPEVVVIGGSVALAWPLLIDLIRTVVSRQAMSPAKIDVRIVAAQLGDDGGLLGALALAAGIIDSNVLDGHPELAGLG